jgi:ATP/ADP translocase
MIKTIGKEIVKPLTHIHNSTFLTEQIPHFLKIALVTPISKQMKIIYLKITDQYGFDMFFKITIETYVQTTT